MPACVNIIAISQQPVEWSVGIDPAQWRRGKSRPSGGEGGVDPVEGGGVDPVEGGGVDPVEGREE